MFFSVRITTDDVSPAFVKLDAALDRPRPILEGVGLEVVSIAQRSFQYASLCVTPGRPNADGSPVTLIEHGVPRHSIRITNMGNTTAPVGSDRVYAAIHQLGGTI
jgi:phage gpG-like protein